MPRRKRPKKKTNLFVDRFRQKTAQAQPVQLELHAAINHSMDGKLLCHCAGLPETKFYSAERSFIIGGMTDVAFDVSITPVMD